MADTGGLPSRFDPRQRNRAGLDVLRHGLPELPAALTYDMSVPMAFWEAGTCAVVLFLGFTRGPGEPPTPLATMGTYHRQDGEWIAERWWTGHGWSPDPVTDPGSLYDLDGRAIVASGGSYADQPGLGPPAATVTGRVSPAVTTLALVQDGHEDQRPLRSHFGAWVVCVERWAPFQVNALDEAGTVIGSISDGRVLHSRQTSG
jgi:hypothetical protein